MILIIHLLINKEWAYHNLVGISPSLSIIKIYKITHGNKVVRMTIKSLSN